MRNNSNKFTIIIPTYNRYPFLFRLLTYLNQYDTIDFNIQILDSSNVVLEDEKLNVLKMWNRVTHKKFDSNTFLSQKLGFGLIDVKTPYAVFCADDDYINPNAIVQCIEFLNSHQDYSSAMGMLMSYSSEKSFKTRQFKWKPMYCNGKSIDDSDASIRLKRTLINYNLPNFYAVHKTELLQLIWLEAAKNTTDWGFSEILPACLSNIHGKFKLLNIYYGTRDANTGSFISFSYNLKMYSDEKRKPVETCLIKHLSKSDNINNEDAKLVVKEGLDVYLKKRLKKDPYQEIKLLFYINKLVKKIINLYSQEKRIRQIKSLVKNDFNGDYLKIKSNFFAMPISYDIIRETRSSNVK